MIALSASDRSAADGFASDCPTEISPDSFPEGVHQALIVRLGNQTPWVVQKRQYGFVGLRRSPLHEYGAIDIGDIVSDGRRAALPGVAMDDNIQLLGCRGQCAEVGAERAGLRWADRTA